MQSLFRNQRILVIVAHPDDEILGLGGTINRLSKIENCVIRVVILGEGITSRSQVRDVKKWEEQLSIHKKNISQAKEILGYNSLEVYDFPDNRFDSVDLLELIKLVEREKEEFEPQVIFTHHGGDLNIDHRRTFEAVMTAFRPLADEKLKTVITFETPSGTEWQASSDPRRFAPNLFITIDEDNLEAKINAMESYENERRAYPHPRSPKALKILAQQRGVTVGKSFVEAFQIIRMIIE